MSFAFRMSVTWHLSQSRPGGNLVCKSAGGKEMLGYLIMRWNRTWSLDD